MVDKVSVWTNGKAIRKYTGQDKNDWLTNHTPEKGFEKRTALLLPSDALYDIVEKDGFTEVRIYHTKS
jgi:hypothetical protein